MVSTGTASSDGSRAGARDPGVDEREARRVAEAAREAEWVRPSFGKELFLGRLRLDLVHPHPQPSPREVEEGEAFLVRLRDFCEREVDPLEIERDAEIPDRVVQGLKDLGAFGMKISKEYGGLGLSTVYYNRALGLTGTWHAALSTILSAHQSIGSRSRSGTSAPRSSDAGTCRGWPARTSLPFCSPSRTSAATRPGSPPQLCRPTTTRRTS